MIDLKFVFGIPHNPEIFRPTFKTHARSHTSIITHSANLLFYSWRREKRPLRAKTASIVNASACRLTRWIVAQEQEISGRGQQRTSVGSQSALSSGTPVYWRTCSVQAQFTGYIPARRRRRLTAEQEVLSRPFCMRWHGRFAQVRQGARLFAEDCSYREPVNCA